MAAHLTHDAVVPPLRSDLNVTAAPTGTGAEVINIRPAGASQSMAMHGFEFSIALMLDGRRTADEVMLSCARLGLPLSLPALEAFVGQLEAHGLLGAGVYLSRPSRPDWPPPVRDLYRSALRTAREGDPFTARRLIEELLAVAPSTPEARRLKSWLDEHATAGSGFQRLLLEVQESWIEPEEAPPGWPARARDTARSHRLALGLALGGVAVLAAAAFIPLPRITAASAVLSPASQVAVLSPGAGVVGTVRVQDGDQVQAGDVLFTWNADDLQLSLLEANERLDAARIPQRAELSANPYTESLLTRLNAAQTELARAQSALLEEQRVSSGSQFLSEVSGGEQRFARAYAEVQAVSEAIDALSPPETVEGMKLSGLVFDVKGLHGRLLHRSVNAEVAGVVSGLSLREGDQVVEGQALMRLNDLTRLKTVAMVTPRQAQTFQVGEPITLSFGGVQSPAVVEAVSGYEIAAEVANPGGVLRLGSSSVDIKRAPQAPLQSLWR